MYLIAHPVWLLGLSVGLLDVVQSSQFLTVNGIINITPEIYVRIVHRHIKLNQLRQTKTKTFNSVLRLKIHLNIHHLAFIFQRQTIVGCSINARGWAKKKESNLHTVRTVWCR